MPKNQNSPIPVEVIVKKPLWKYLNEFWGLKAAQDLMALGLFPNMKEITESFGAYNAVRKYLNKDFAFKDPNVTVIVVGDGSTPRTAATFAFRSNWRCISIDPLMNDARPWSQKINRLNVIKARVEDVQFDETWGSKIIIVAVHAHLDLMECIKFKPSAVIAIPCCVPLEWFTVRPSKEYRDYGILSPENKVKIWRIPEGRSHE
jgi:hypothetical protein